MNNDELENISEEANVNNVSASDPSIVSENPSIVSPEQPIGQPVPNPPPQLNNNINTNTIQNSVNSLKNGVKTGQNLAKTVQSLKSKNGMLNAATNALASNKKEGANGESSANGKGGTEKKQSVADKAVNKVASQVISKYTHGVVKAKHIEKLLEKSKAVDFAKKRLKIGIAVGVAVGLLIIVVITSILMNNDDESYTSSRTNNYIIDQSSDQDLLEYMGYISVCPTITEAKEKAEKYGIELVDGEVTFEVMEQIAEQDGEELTETCRNAIKFYRAFKGEYVENRKPCYRDRDENKETLPNYWRHSDPESSFSSNPKVQAYFVKGEASRKDEYDCQLKLPTLLMFETMSYDLTDQDLFNKEYLTRPNYSEYYIDLRKLANALSEFMHETCYQWEIQYYLRGTHVENCSGPECSVVKTKVPYDGYYFQVSFDKYVCYLKYGDTCEHPNYDEKPKPREKYPDMDYMKHECGSPENDELSKLGGREKEEEKIDAVVWLGDSLTYGLVSPGDGKEAPYEHMGIGIPASAPVQIIGGHAREIIDAAPTPEENKFYVIWAGNTDYGDAGSNYNAATGAVQHVIGIIKDYVESNNIEYYLVLGTQDSQNKPTATINGALASAFPGHFMSIDGLYEFDPKGDHIHFTADSYKKIGEAVGQKVMSMTGSNGSTPASGVKYAKYTKAADGQVYDGNGQEIVDYALQFVGNPYVYGGTSLTDGVDCSGFVMKVYENFGITLDHSSSAQAKVGKSIGSLADAKPGDLIYYPPNGNYSSGHIGIYIGNNKVVSAKTEKLGIQINDHADYRPIGDIRRIVE